MIESSSTIDAANGHHEQVSQASQRDETQVLNCPDDPSVSELTGNAPPRHPTMLLDDGLLSDLQQHEDSHPLDLLKKAIAAAQSGNKILARLHLEQVIASNPDNPIGWLWFAWVADSPAAAVSALEQSRLNSQNSTLLDHGLAWARGMQEFQLDWSSQEKGAEVQTNPKPTVERSKTHLLQEDCAEDRCVVADQPRPLTQLIDVADKTDPTPTSVQPTNEAISDSECGTIDPDTTPTKTASVRTELLGQEATPVTADRPATDDDGGTGYTQEIATPSAQMANEQSINHPGMTILFTDGEFEQVPGVEAETDSPRPPVESSPAPTDPPSVAESAGDQPGDNAADIPATDKRAAVENVSPASENPLPPCEQPTILAIDDSPTVRSLVSLTLQKNGYQVVTATDGVDALDRIKSCKPALILMDINMPKLNGYQLCKLLKKHKEMREIPVIMLSGKDGVFDKLRGNMCGCDDYITKPFESADLVQKVSAFLTGVATRA